MGTRISFNLITGLLAAGFLLLIIIFDVLHASLGIPISRIGQQITQISLLFLILTWFENDRRNRSLNMPFDVGYLVAVFWPLYLPIYLVKTRGRKAILAIVILIFIFGIAVMFDLVMNLVIPII